MSQDANQQSHEKYPLPPSEQAPPASAGPAPAGGFLQGYQTSASYQNPGYQPYQQYQQPPVVSYTANPQPYGVAPQGVTVMITQPEPYPYDKSTDEHRKAAIGLSATAMCCGCWLLAIPAFILALVPACNPMKAMSRQSKPLYVAAIVLAVIAITCTIIAIAVAIAVTARGVQTVTSESKTFYVVSRNT